MATYTPLHNTPVQYMDNSGDPLVNGTLEFYDAGTTDGQDLFSDDTGTPIGISITLNSWGMPESGGNTIFLFRDQAKALKVVGKNAVGATIWTADDIPAVASFDSASSDKLATVEENADVTDYTNVSAAGALMQDGSTSMSGDLVFDGGAYVNWSTVAGIVASTTQTQGETPLTSSLSVVSTVANDLDTVTLPTAVAGRELTVKNNGANTLQIFPNTDDSIDTAAADVAATLAAGETQIFIAKSSVTWETLLEPVTAVLAGSSKYASFYEEANATAYNINAQTDVHAYHNAGIVDGGSSGWTFGPGGSGVPVAIASIADGADSGVDIAVSTTGNHGLAVGDVISQTNLTSAVYTGIFAVKAVISTTIYEVEAVYTATDTGTMDQAAVLTCDVGSDGTYDLDWSASASSATSSEVFDFTVYKNAAVLTGSSTRRKFGTGGDVGSLSGHTIPFSAVAGDKLSFMVVNNDSVGDVTIRNIVVRLQELV